VNNLFTNLHTTLTLQNLHFISLEQKANPVYIYMYKQGWNSIHNKYKACQSKCKHTTGKPKQSKGLTKGLMSGISHSLQQNQLCNVHIERKKTGVMGMCHSRYSRDAKVQLQNT
jgi:hypothetical protein